jgi:trans-2-enoyl-CoA reductase
MNAKYLIFSLFLCVNVFSQNTGEIKEQCKSKYDSMFRDFFGDKFSKKNIRFDKDKYLLRVDTIDIDSDDFTTSKTIYLNMNNIELLEKLS